MTADADRALSPVPLMQLATGFWAFKTLAAAHELDLFSRLSGTAGTTAGGLAEALAIKERPAEMLLTGCAALGLLVKNDSRYVNSPIAEEFLVRGKPYYFGGWLPRNSWSAASPTTSAAGCRCSTSGCIPGGAG